MVPPGVILRIYISYVMLCLLNYKKEILEMEYRFRPRGVCAQEMRVDLDDQGVIRELKVLGGCSGNLQGIAALVKGMYNGTITVSNDITEMPAAANVNVANLGHLK